MRRLLDRQRRATFVERERVVFSLRSPFGISHARIERVEAWPKQVVLRLHLSGLEQLQITNGTDTVFAAVSSTNAVPRVRVWLKDQEQRPLDSQHPLWLAIRGVTNHGQPTDAVPLKDGYFEVTLPEKLLAGNPRAITVSWIDFYRN